MLSVSLGGSLLLGRMRKLMQTPFDGQMVVSLSRFYWGSWNQMRLFTGFIIAHAPGYKGDTPMSLMVERSGRVRKV